MHIKIPYAGIHIIRNAFLFEAKWQEIRSDERPLADTEQKEQFDRLRQEQRKSDEVTEAVPMAN
jgi:hypothetical protein